MMIRRAMLPARPFQHPHNRLLGGGDLYVGACHGYVGVTYVMWHVWRPGRQSRVIPHSPRMYQPPVSSSQRPPRFGCMEPKSDRSSFVKNVVLFPLPGITYLADGDRAELFT